jgi:aspartate aminotransferase
MISGVQMLHFVTSLVRRARNTGKSCYYLSSGMTGRKPVHQQKEEMRISQRMGAARPLATTAMHGRVEAMQTAGEAVIDFSIAISHFAAPAAVRQSVAEAAMHTRLAYTSVSGSESLRRLLATKVQQDNAIDAQPHEIIVTNGAKQALYEALSVLTNPGDTVIVLRPYWPAYVATAHLLQLKVALVDLPEQLTPAFFSTLPKARLFILNNPHNPSGKVFSADELALLAAWMRGNDCGAIVDESYEKLIFEGRHHSLASLADWRALCIVTLFSASQSYAMMGWRAGFAVAPAEVVRAMEILQGPITAAPSALTQVATGAAFSSGEPVELLADYRIRRDLVLQLLAQATWMTMHSPDSGPYLWGDVRALECDTVAFAEQLLAQHKVALMPGDALGQPGWIRIGYIADDLDTLRRGISAILAFGNALQAGVATLAPL